ncbi:hypothetical protein Poly51_26360 [Rubripirellula tenax]|uniref:DUF1853 domain-containing protein n=1 Tax=Rubripirellula tenax TaxID=2528015 RepID=A0A5C6FAS5_9BACT|nr:DUF1853 family protein [Rubripirellula tenax]TWU56719.1 hypothetical protein Poly51_26360 [Rubripirellula tenax]
MLSGPQLLADLAWAINSPALASVQTEPLPVEHAVPAEALATEGLVIVPSKIDVDHLVEFFRYQPPRKVGHYFERLMHYWLAHVRGVEIVAASEQIRRGNDTLGEVDFVFRDEAGRLNHLEVAVKFYLYQHDQTILGSHFIGPNLRDTFQRKIDRIEQHQLPISRGPYSGIEIRQAIVKGVVFYESSQFPPSTLPDRMLADHLRGTIIRSSDLDIIRHDAQFRYRVLNKPFWLSAIAEGAGTWNSLSTGEQVVHRIGQSDARFGSPVLLARFQLDGDRVQEADRIFVVDDCWPN